MIWVYAIGDRPEVPSPPDAVGLAGAPVEGVREGELLAVLSRHDELPAVRGVEALWTHEHVVEGLMAQRAVLPMRFGSRLPGDAALRDALTIRQGELLAALDGVRGRVELAVRAMSAAGADRGDGAEDAPAGAAEGRETGREYLRAKLELRRRADAAGVALHAPLAALAVAATRRPGQVPGELLRAAYLVERPVVAEFRAAAQRLQRKYRDAAVLCTGPWPPYSFVDVAVGSRVGVGLGG